VILSMPTSVPPTQTERLARCMKLYDRLRTLVRQTREVQEALQQELAGFCDRPASHSAGPGVALPEMPDRIEGTRE